MDDHLQQRGRRGSSPPDPPQPLGTADDSKRIDSPNADLPLDFFRTLHSNLEQPDPDVPLKGNSLFIFSPQNPLRRFLCDVLVYPATEPLLLILMIAQAVLFTVEALPSLSNWGHVSLEWALLGIFVVSTIEVIARIIVSGLILNRSSSGDYPFSSDAIHSIKAAQRFQLARRAFLRHSFNRLDLVAIVSFWIHLSLNVSGVDNQYHIHVFRMLRCIRIMRLLALTTGTANRLRTIRKCFPLLALAWSVIIFLMLLFAIVGLQFFKSSLRRHCTWLDSVDPTNLQRSYTSTTSFCSGHLDADSGKLQPWVFSPFSPGALDSLQPSSKLLQGYICPRGSVCLMGDNPYIDTVSFDNTLNTLEIAFIVLSGSTFSKIMYWTIKSTYLPAALFFAAGILCLRLWAVNFLIVNATAYFQVVREEIAISAFATSKSAFATSKDSGGPALQARIPRWSRIFWKTHWLWTCPIVLDLICQSLRTPSMPARRQIFLDISEVVVTFLLDFDIIIRALSLGTKSFRASSQHVLDSALAVATTISAILLLSGRLPPQAHAGLSIFRLLRAYRIVQLVPMTRKLAEAIILHASELANLSLFVFLLTYFMTILALQLFKGDIPGYDANGNFVKITFSDTLNAFYGMYQILSREQWTEILFSVTAATKSLKTAWISGLFLSAWYVLAIFFTMLQFLPVMLEVFEISNKEKRIQQLRAFVYGEELGRPLTCLSLRNILPLRSWAGYRQFQVGRLLVQTTTMPFLGDSTVQEFTAGLDEDEQETLQYDLIFETRTQSQKKVPRLLEEILRKTMETLGKREKNPFHSGFKPVDPLQLAKQAISVTTVQQLAQQEFIARHPKYNNTLYIFKPKNPIRGLCQRLVSVGPGRKRFEGVEPKETIQFVFSAVICAATVATTALACIATPIYRREYFNTHGYSIGDWFVWTDILLTTFFTVEAIIRLIADGFFWTPCAYYRTFWGLTDGLVLITMWTGTATMLATRGAVPRSLAVLRAARAFRLLTVSDSARETFRSLMFTGLHRTFAAATLSISIIIPFAIYGLNLFSNQFISCNDDSTSISALDQCFGDFSSTPSNPVWPLLAPRVARNPWFEFDTFSSALLTTFRIVTQNGWTDVSFAAQSINGPGKQPRAFSSPGYGMMLVAFNFITTVFILILFLAVFIANFAERTGMAYLDSDQLAWLVLRERLRRVQPLKRPKQLSRLGWWRDGDSIWSKIVTGVLVAHLALLLSEFYAEPAAWTRTRNGVLLAFSTFYMAHMVIWVVAEGFSHIFRSRRALFALFSILGTFATSIMSVWQGHNPQNSLTQAHNIFLVMSVLLLIRQTPVLRNLLTAAAGTLPALANVLAIWFVFLLAFAIALTEAFSLTRFGPNGDTFVNFRTIPNALVILFRLSFGEGWNALMEDFTISPPFCVQDSSPFSRDGDCGSPIWARILFISWNILSQFLFANMVVAVMYEQLLMFTTLSLLEMSSIYEFRKAWAAVDLEGTGFVDRDGLHRLLRELRGPLHMRLYQKHESVQAILSDVKKEDGEVDVYKLTQRLGKIDAGEKSSRRWQLDVLVEEVLSMSDLERGIPFVVVLQVLVFNNVVKESKFLRLEDLVIRRARLQRVNEKLARQTIAGYLETVYLSRKFKAYLRQKRLMQQLVSTVTPAAAVPVEHGNSETVRKTPNLPIHHEASFSASGPSSARPSLSSLQREGQVFESETQNIGAPREPAGGNRHAGSSQQEQGWGFLGDESVWVESIRPSATRRVADSYV